MRRLGSCVIAAADETQVPAGGALAVDRELFAKSDGADRIPSPDPGIREEVDDIPDGIVVIATGPLTSEALAKQIKELTGSEDLYFYDAAAPIVVAETIDESKGFWGARWQRGGDDYFNCVLEKDEYLAFYEALLGRGARGPYRGGAQVF